jgi:hypothetical protein
MSTRGVVDLVVCLDVSASMRPCIDGVRRHVAAFLDGMRASGQSKIDLRLDVLAYSCDGRGRAFNKRSLRHDGMDLIGALYGQGGVPRPDTFFTDDFAAFRDRLDEFRVGGDEATLLALDIALDFPWRPRAGTHRVVLCLTDEPLETGALVSEQRNLLPALIDKVQALGVLLFLVAPPSRSYETLAEADKSEYLVVDRKGDGLQHVDLGRIIEGVGKSVSVARYQAGAEPTAPRALFGQDRWMVGHLPITGR